MNPLLLIKRPADFLLFIYLAIVMSFLQADTRLTCQLMKIFATSPPLAVVTIVLLVTGASYAVITTTFLPRFIQLREAVASAAVHFVAFALAAMFGVTLRLLFVPATECIGIRWPFTPEQWLTMLLLVIVAASLFTAVLSIVTPQKIDYSELRERVHAYMQALRDEQISGMSTIQDLLQKAYDTAEKTRMADTSAQYRHAVRTRVSEHLSQLLETANNVRQEEFLKLIGHRDPGLAPADAVAAASRAQRELERIWPPPPRP